MSYLFDKADMLGLGVSEYLENIAELKAMGMAPSESYTCCATGTCS
jgi:hypothetical protein